MRENMMYSKDFRKSCTSVGDFLFICLIKLVDFHLFFFNFSFLSTQCFQDLLWKITFIWELHCVFLKSSKTLHIQVAISFYLDEILQMGGETLQRVFIFDFFSAQIRVHEACLSAKSCRQFCKLDGAFIFKNFQG